jgi:hypothetical protein
MKYRIPLTDHNKQILIDQFQADTRCLTSDYWLTQLMNDPTELFRILDSKHGSLDPQIRLQRWANRRLRRYIRTITGLPRMNGSEQCKRTYTKFFKQHNFQLNNQEN